NPKSITTIATRVPSTLPKPHTAASLRPVESCAAATRSGYVFWSTKPSGSSDVRPWSRSSNDPASRSWPRRTGARSGQWWPQAGPSDPRDPGERDRGGGHCARDDEWPAIRRRAVGVRILITIGGGRVEVPPQDRVEHGIRSRHRREGHDGRATRGELRAAGL